MTFDIPILFLFFNRPDTTKKVFERIREIQPAKFFIAADGPRENKEGEKERCETVRKLVLEHIDWPCEVKMLLRDKNLGCRQAVSEAITWFFNDVEEGIVLEDDILPDISFFRFCEEMLIKYRTDKRVRFINGCNFGHKGLKSESYGFTRFMHMWGWASWRRSIDLVNYEMREWKLLESKENFLNNYFNFLSDQIREKAVDRFYSFFDNTAVGNYDTWDFQVVFSNMFTNTLACYPNVNLVTNIGFNAEATHTNFDAYYIDDLKASTLPFPLVHAKEVVPNLKYELFVLERWANIKIKPSLYYSLEHRYFKYKRKLENSLKRKI